MNIFSNINKGTIIVVVTMTIMVVLGLSWAWIYYGNINNAEDPRVINAKQMYRTYDQLAEQKKYDSILLLLSNMEHIYLEYEDYKQSYEVGVICNNRAAIFITVALFETNDTLEKQVLLNKALINVDRSIQIYEQWKSKFGGLSPEELIAYVSPIYQQQNSLFHPNKISNYIEKRTEELLIAQKELPRRLSVSYTNLGMVQRHQHKTHEAIESYKEAVGLWAENYTAENNIRIILGQPMKERGVLERLFPPEK